MLVSGGCMNESLVQAVRVRVRVRVQHDGKPT